MAAPRNPWRSLGVYVALAACLWAGVEYYRAFIRYAIAPRNFGTVVEGKIYRSGRQSPAQLKKLVEQHAIRTIVDLGSCAPGSPEEDRAALTAKALGVDRKVFILWGDGTGDPNRYVQALRIIADPSRQPVLVHCATGAQRTSACTIFYRNIFEGKPVDASYEEAKLFKHSPTRNPKLKPYVDRWAEPIKKAYATSTLIPYSEPVSGNHDFPSD